MGEFCLLVELHREGPATNRASPSSLSNYEREKKTAIKSLLNPDLGEVPQAEQEE